MPLNGEVQWAPPTNQHIQQIQKNNINFLLFNAYYIYNNLVGKGVAGLLPIGESCKTLTLPKYQNYRCFVLGMWRIIFDILGLLNFWNESFKKVYS